MNSDAKNAPRTSIIVLSFNGLEHLPGCIGSISNQTDQNFELIIVDNASKDDSVIWIQQHCPSARLILSKKNIGYSGGMNLGARASAGTFLLLLNQDVVLEPECLERLCRELDHRSDTFHAVFPMVRFYHARDFINAYGAAWYETCQWRDTRVGLMDLGQYSESEQVFGSIFPAVMFRKDKFFEIGAFDELFWSYNEDFDICYRSNLFGYKFICTPKAVIFHKYRASSKDSSDPLWSKYWFIRNYFLVFLKNYELSSLIKYRKILFMRYLGHATKDAWKFRRFRELILYFKIVVWLVIRSPWIMKRRYFIQKHRKIPDNNFWVYGKVEEYNLYHYNGAIVLSLKALRASTRGEKYMYRAGRHEFSSI
jgi:GT2 family glycosyltransferase